MAKSSHLSQININIAMRKIYDQMKRMFIIHYISIIFCKTVLKARKLFFIAVSINIYKFSIRDHARARNISLMKITENVYEHLILTSRVYTYISFESALRITRIHSVMRMAASVAFRANFIKARATFFTPERLLHWLLCIRVTSSF